ncbi:helix-turn-helix transcriptional regulator [Longimicrobium terrae]|uniref:Uncharacterized protein n=1 Tax=Longimicrobium terrae TaxID=1639882 RepID=A0A841GSP7_9BACT|nr:helix-turn-helix transcriptional regulator [Longimicrobium terrae]MBB4635924.1 hypothetical protein [Longimicrobium terrae]MBB6070320.1 hypothetical protein [Longimicrobium terrae]NNC30821.1 helix-turn-helix transcriptional regulator [Longimicrobium terrae]
MRRTDTIRRTYTPAQDERRFREERELETLRHLVRRELRIHAGQRTLAREMGIDRGSLRKFAAGQSTPGEWTLRQIREWAADRPELPVPIAAVALALLVDGLPPDVRPHARREVSATLAGLYESRREGVPTWIADELEGAELPPAVRVPASTANSSPDRALLLRLQELVREHLALS